MSNTKRSDPIQCPLVTTTVLKCGTCYYCRDASSFPTNFALYVDPLNGSDTENLGQTSNQPLATLEKAIEELGRYHWKGTATIWISGALTLSGTNITLPAPAAGLPRKIVVRGLNPTSSTVTITTATGLGAWNPGTTLTVNRYPQAIISGTHTPNTYTNYAFTQTSATGHEYFDVVYSNTSNTLNILNPNIAVGTATLSIAVDQLSFPAATSNDYLDIITNGNTLVFRDLIISTAGLTIGSSPDSSEYISYERCRFLMTAGVYTGLIHGRIHMAGCYSSVPGGVAELLARDATNQLRMEYCWLTDTIVEITGNVVGRRQDPRTVRFDSSIFSGSAQHYVNMHDVSVFGGELWTTVGASPVQHSECSACKILQCSFDTPGIPAFAVLDIFDNSFCSVVECEFTGDVSNGIAVHGGSQLLLEEGNTPSLFNDTTLLASAILTYDNGDLVMSSSSATSVSGAVFTEALLINTGGRVRVNTSNFGGAANITYNPDAAGTTNVGANPFWPPLYPPTTSVTLMSHA